MKTKLFLAILAVGFALNISAQNVFQSDLENWAGSPLNPTDWMGSKTNLAVDSVIQNATTPYHGTYCAKIVSRSSSAKRFTTQPVAITMGKAYMVSYSARGKGSIRAGIYTGSHGTAAGYYYSNYETVSATTWHRFKQSVMADTTNSTTAQFILAVKNTVAANNDLDVDSVTIEEYTPQNAVSLYNIEYTTSGSGNSPYYGQMITNFGGIATATYATGYYLQTSGTNAWAAVQVYDPTNAANVAIGDSIKITANIDEYFNMTEVTNVLVFSKVSSGNTVPAPAVLATTNDVNAEMYEGILVQATGPYVAASWSSAYHTWNLDDGSGAAVVDKQIFDAFPSVAPTAGTYKVTGPVNYSFSAFSIEPRTAADVVFVSGVEQYTNTLNAVVYPNPVSNKLTVQLPFNAQNAKVSVTDVLGNEIMSVSANGTEVTLEGLNMASGVYMVKILADNKVQQTKIVKQ